MVAWLHKGFNQVLVTGLVCFCCPGFFNALVGLGGAGTSDPDAAAATNAALYFCFAVFGYLGGAFFNMFGPRILMSAGGLTYAFYTAAAYISNRFEGWNWLFILSGAVVGLGAGWLWTAQGAMMMAYSPNDRKGHYIGIFWLVFNLGAFLGGILQFAINFDNTGGTANLTSYCVTIGVMVAGSIIAGLFIVPPGTVIREDGVSVVMEKAKGPKEEFTEVLSVIFDKSMILLSILFLGSNYFYTYVFSGVNASLFTMRTRGLNSALYWLAQMIGAVGLGWILDNRSKSLKYRATLGFALVAVFMNITYAMGAYLQLGFENGYDKNSPLESIDFTDSRYAYPVVVYVLYGFGDSMIQAFSYWIMGAIAQNDTVLCARYTGFYKSVQSLGAAVSWLLDLQYFNISYTIQFWICWALFLAALPPAFVVVRNINNASSAETSKGDMVKENEPGDKNMSNVTAIVPESQPVTVVVGQPVASNTDL